MDQGRVCKWINTVVMDISWLASWLAFICVCEIVCITCGRVLLPGWMSSCLPAAQRRCRFDTWYQSWGRPLVPKANSPARSYLTWMEGTNYGSLRTNMVVKSAPLRTKTFNVIQSSTNWNITCISSEGNHVTAASHSKQDSLINSFIIKISFRVVVLKFMYITLY